MSCDVPRDLVPKLDNYSTMPIPDPAIPTGATVVVIGANGYMALEVCEKLLIAGYHVRGTVRDVEKHEDVCSSIFSNSLIES